MKLWQKTTVLYLSWRVWILALAWLATLWIPFVQTFTPHATFGGPLPYLAWVWGNFDGMVFMLVAKSGYSAEQLPFFPLFPLTVRAVSSLGIPHLYAGLIVSTVCFVTSLFIIQKILKIEKLSRLFWPMLMLMLAYPTAFFYASVYNDSLFLLLATATVWLAREKRWVLASLAGGAASLARLNGVALLGVVAVEYLLTLEPKLIEWKLSSLWSGVKKALNPQGWWNSKVFFALLIPLAFVGYLAWIQFKFGDWHLFFDGVAVWHRNKLTFPLQTFWRYVKILFFTPNFTFTYTIAWLEAIATGLYLLVLGWSWGKIRPSYWAFMLFHLLIPTVTGTLQGMPRYGLHIFPLFVSLALFFEKKPRWLQMTWFVISIGLQVFFLSFFTRGYFVS